MEALHVTEHNQATDLSEINKRKRADNDHVDRLAEIAKVHQTFRDSQERKHEIETEFTASHNQYIFQRISDLATLLTTEIHSLQCETRRNRAEVLTMVSHSSGTRAGKLAGLAECTNVKVHYDQALLYQCESVKVEIAPLVTQCGVVPVVKRDNDTFSISLSGLEVIPFSPCLHADKYVLVNDQTYEYNKTSSDFSPTTSSTHLSHENLIRSFGFTIDKRAIEGLSLHSDSNYNMLSMLGDVTSLLESSGQASLKGVLQEERRIGNLPDITS
jgi:hypothetical protein